MSMIRDPDCRQNFLKPFSHLYAVIDMIEISSTVTKSNNQSIDCWSKSNVLDAYSQRSTVLFLITLPEL